MKPAESSYHPPRRKPAQKTLERILEGAEDQLREQGLDAFTIQSVLQRTGLSVGAFYSRFPDKTALIHELQLRAHRRIEPRLLGDLADRTGTTDSLEEAVDYGFGVLTHYVINDRAIFRAFMMLTVFDPVMMERAEQYSSKRKQGLDKLLAPHRDEIGHSDPDFAINNAYAVWTGTMRGRLMYYDAADTTQFGVTDETLFGELTRCLTLYLQGSAQSTGASVATVDSTKRGG
jgi:AcrR family transcriptional regulator